MKSSLLIDATLMTEFLAKWKLNRPVYRPRPIRESS